MASPRPGRARGREAGRGSTWKLSQRDRRLDRIPLVAGGVNAALSRSVPDDDIALHTPGLLAKPVSSAPQEL